MNNLMNILRAMSVVTIFALAATVSMAPDGFDMSAGTLGTFSAYVFAALFLWFGAPLWLAIVLTIVFTMVMYLLTMFLILVCKIPDMLATCALQFVHAGLGLAFTGGSAVSAGLSAPKWFGALHGGDVTPLRKGWTTGSMNIGKSPYIIIIMLLCVVVCWVLLERTKHGRYLYATKQQQNFPVSMLRNTDLWQVCSQQYLSQLQVLLYAPVTQQLRSTAVTVT